MSIFFQRKMGGYVKSGDDLHLKTEESDILIEIDANIWTFLQSFEIGSLLSVCELMTLATKHRCDQCSEVFYSSGLFQDHLLSHVEKTEEEGGHCGQGDSKTGFESDEEKEDKKELNPINLLKVSLKAYEDIHNEDIDIDEGYRPPRKKRKAKPSKKLCVLCAQSQCVCVIDDYDNPRCGICGKEFPTRKKVREHVTQHKRSIRKRKEKQEATYMNESAEPVVCQICNFVLPSNITLERHNLIRHDPVKPCQFCDHVSTTTEEFKKHEATHSSYVRGSYPCEICGTVLTTKGNLGVHYERMHAEDSKKELFCAKCGKSCLGKYALAKHSKRCGEKTVKCTVDGCTQAFYTEREQRKHIDVVHLNIKPYHCEICGESFAKKELLTGHKLIHSDERTCICPFCGKGFKQSATLYRHKKSCQLNPDREASNVNKTQAQWQAYKIE